MEPFVRARLADGASATTINRSLEVVRTILNRAAGSYRDADTACSWIWRAPKAGRPHSQGKPPRGDYGRRQGALGADHQGLGVYRRLIRLRAAGVGFETRQALLGQHNGSLTTHYSAAEIAELLDAVNRINATRSASDDTSAGSRVKKSREKIRRRRKRKGLAFLQALDYLARPAGFEPTTPWFVV